MAHHPVELTGHVLKGRTREEVVGSLQKLFNVSPQKAEALLAGKPRTVKNCNSAAEAQKYRDRLESIGVEVKPVKAATGAANVNDAADRLDQDNEEPATVDDRNAPHSNQIRENLSGESSASRQANPDQQTIGRLTNKFNLKIVAGAASVLIIASLAIGYNIWTQSVAYSLLQVRAAVESNDPRLFEKHVDLDSLLDRAVDGFLREMVREEMQDSTGAEAFGAALGAGMIAMVKPQIVAYLKNELLRSLEGQLSERGRELGSTAPPKVANGIVESIGSTFIVDDQLPSLSHDYTEKLGKTAFAGFSFFNKDLNDSVLVEFKLRQIDSYWVIVELANLPEIISAVEAAEAAKIDNANKLIADAMELSVGLSANNFSWNTAESEVNIRLEVTNSGPAIVSRFLADFQIEPEFGPIGFKSSFSGPLIPGETAVYNVSHKPSEQYTLLFGEPDPSASSMSYQVEMVEVLGDTQLSLLKDDYDGELVAVAEEIVAGNFRIPDEAISSKYEEVVRLVRTNFTKWNTQRALGLSASNPENTDQWIEWARESTQLGPMIGGKGDQTALIQLAGDSDQVDVIARSSSGEPLNAVTLRSEDYF